jgi:hypothetical protein
MKSKLIKVLTVIIPCFLFFGTSYLYSTPCKSENLSSFFQKKKKANATSIQCKAKAKSTKRRCRNMTSNASGYCRTHGG